MQHSDSSSNYTSGNNLSKFKVAPGVKNLNLKSSGYFTEKRMTEEPPLDAASEENHVNPLDSPTFQKNFASIEANVAMNQRKTVEQNDTITANSEGAKDFFTKMLKQSSQKQKEMTGETMTYADNNDVVVYQQAQTPNTMADDKGTLLQEQETPQDKSEEMLL